MKREFMNTNLIITTSIGLLSMVNASNELHVLDEHNAFISCYSSSFNSAVMQPF